jgi:hypothetical protein
MTCLWHDAGRRERHFLIFRSVRSWHALFGRIAHFHRHPTSSSELPSVTGTVACVIQSLLLVASVGKGAQKRFRMLGKPKPLLQKEAPPIVKYQMRLHARRCCCIYAMSCRSLCQSSATSTCYCIRNGCCARSQPLFNDESALCLWLSR